MNDSKLGESRQLGEIPVEDYLRITGGRIADSGGRRSGARSGTRRVALVAVGLLSCLLCTAAGDYFNPFYGDPSDMTLEQAAEVLQQNPEKKYEADVSMFVAARRAYEVLALLKGVAETSPRDASNASLYMAGIGELAVEYLIDLRDQGVLPEVQRRSLEGIRSETTKDDD